MFKILKKDGNTRARLGILETKHGVIETPSYVVVGTHAKVRTLTPADLVSAKTQLIIANTYHLWRSLGEEGLKTFPGLHRVMDWPRPLMTDSGGFQVFSLGIAREQGIGKMAENDYDINLQPKKNLVRVTDEGVFFKENGKDCYLDAEISIRIQQQLGADIILAFDEPTSPLHNHHYTRESLERTHKWAIRSLKARTSNQALYGIVQGGVFEDLRHASAEFIGKMDFEGFAIGGAFGASYGSKKEHTFQELEWTCPLLPEEKPRHLLGIGLIEDLFRGVETGIDTFDCVVPTREARHGCLWTRSERIDLKKGKWRDDSGVLDPECGCEVCAEMKMSKGALRALFKEKNQEAGRLASIHNVYFFNDLMEKIRRAIARDQLSDLKKKYVKVEL